MRKRVAQVFVLVMMLAGAAARAQEAPKPEPSGWKKGLIGVLTLTQNSYSNWTQGGENAVAWKGVIETLWENNQATINWKNTAKLAYGQVKQGDQEVRKSDDELRVESVLTYKVGKYLNPYISFNGLTQIANGYDYSKQPRLLVSDSFDPTFLRQSMGMGYKASGNFVTRLGLSLKETIVGTQAFRPLYGNTLDENVRVETGIESVTDFSHKLEENVLFTSKLEMFSAFEHFDKVDVNWDNTLTAKLGKLFTANLNVRLLYDEDLSKKRQLKQVLGFGVSYTFF
ncbi:MAG: DUF3078 domain-containing protein [candidate division KSB1 bacterium]|nr:DUF3078 domain-containing protein [candidate division KSB1 bacterium]MDZ7275684.1 DUF3078 domain-containing protein [candidate division KSB1 bacterium]MDZ7284625.1 DUF3078 domain-containing protein [candidate division KSB1 bacterium]MDZ7297956.1 DUF3078 domain-containing protein [candidate division KSB1 bacterium]MDZ7308315.1 DUF3078 domain-containing protein [candidate division KSB1 bacterium]